MKQYNKRDEESYECELNAENRIGEINNSEPEWFCPLKINPSMSRLCGKNCYCFMEAWIVKDEKTNLYEIFGFDCHNMMFSSYRDCH